MACDEIVLIDDRSSSVSLPELPLLGVLPGTGGLTRLTDKRRVRRDHADVFCTTAEGLQGQRAKEWRLVDHIVELCEERAAETFGSSESVGEGARIGDADLREPFSESVDSAAFHPFLELLTEVLQRPLWNLSVRPAEEPREAVHEQRPAHEDAERD